MTSNGSTFLFIFILVSNLKSHERLVLAQSIVTLLTVILLENVNSRKLRDLIKANRGGTNAIESL